MNSIVNRSRTMARHHIKNMCGQMSYYNNFVLTRCYSSNANVNTLVLVEQTNDGKITAGTLSCITAAKNLGGNITALVCSTPSSSSSLAEQAAKIDGVNKVILHEGDVWSHAIAENLAFVLSHLQQGHSYTHILAQHSTLGKSVLPRLAAEFDVSPISDIVSVTSEKEFVRPIYAGNAICHLESSDALKLITVRPTAFDKAMMGESAQADIEKLEVEVKPDSTVPEWISEQLSKSDRPELGSARVVVSGGRGLKVHILIFSIFSVSQSSFHMLNGFTLFTQPSFHINLLPVYTI